MVINQRVITNILSHTFYGAAVGFRGHGSEEN